MESELSGEILRKMSKENAEIVRRGYDAFNRADQEGMVADLAPTFEYVVTGAVPDFPGPYRGAAGWVEAMRWLRDEFENPQVNASELLEREDKVLARITIHGRGKQSGAEVTWELWQLWTFHEGKIVRGQGFRSREQVGDTFG
jgi:ketosteroid isomerase-like protein